MLYKTIHTTIGLQLLASAEATGSKIEITHMAVGDGNGNEIIPNPTMKQLKRERFRAPVNRIYQDPENENLFTAELIIPVETTSFVVREIAVFDRNGNMLMVGNTPEVHKPSLSDGAFSDSAYRIPFVVSNSDSIELKIDPNVVTATHSWIMNTLTTAYFFPGGTIGQVLKKKSNIEGDIEWDDASNADVFVNTVEEEQSLVANQTIVDLTSTTTRGAAVYINGERITNKIGANGWLATSNTQITLGKAYSGAKILIVQNEPLGAAPYPLAQKNNLSDILNKPLARQNLGVISSDEAKYNDCPPGTVITLASQNIPTGYRLLKCNGAAYSRTAYADLFAAIGIYYGAGDGVNTFNVPDARAEFPRYADDGRGIDVGRLIGSKQGDAIRNITGDAPGGSGARVPESSYTGAFSVSEKAAGRISTGENWGLLTATFDASRVVPTANENRPRNIAWLACIRY
ncbi:Phage Tail Collar Domain protein [compost metagenome]